MTAEVRYFVIYGVTESGSTFRPSDWAERLAGVLAPYRPPGTLGGYISYSPYAVPSTLEGQRCVVVDGRLRDLHQLLDLRWAQHGAAGWSFPVHGWAFCDA